MVIWKKESISCNFNKNVKLEWNTSSVLLSLSIFEIPSYCMRENANQGQHADKQG